MDRVKNRITRQALILFEGGIKIQSIQNVLVLLFPDNNEGHTKDLVEKSIEMYCSLNKAVDKAGGCGYSVEMLQGKTMLEMITTLSVNHVRFIHEKN